jgi:hypothetical protein
MRTISNRRHVAGDSSIAACVQEKLEMARCDQCGNDYDKSFQVTMASRTMRFDSFECAIQALAHTCPQCGTRIIGHGVEQNGTIFCCVHCAKKHGVTRLRDRD